MYKYWLYMWYPWLPVACRTHTDNPFLVLVVVSNLFYFIWIKLVNFFKPIDSDPPLPQYHGINVLDTPWNLRFFLSISDRPILRSKRPKLPVSIDSPFVAEHHGGLVSINPPLPPSKHYGLFMSLPNFYHIWFLLSHVCQCINFMQDSCTLQMLC